MRKSTMLWLLLSFVAGASLFMTSQRVTDLRQQLALVNSDIRQEEERLRVLQAEWSYLNQPERLERRAQQHLKMSSMHGNQFIAATDLQKPVAHKEPDPVKPAPQKNDPKKTVLPEITQAPPPHVQEKPRTAAPPQRSAQRFEQPRTATPKTAAKATPKPAPAQTTAARDFDAVLKRLGTAP